MKGNIGYGHWSLLGARHTLIAVFLTGNKTNTVGFPSLSFFFLGGGSSTKTSWTGRTWAQHGFAPTGCSLFEPRSWPPNGTWGASSARSTSQAFLDPLFSAWRCGTHSKRNVEGCCYSFLDPERTDSFSLPWYPPFFGVKGRKKRVLWGSRLNLLCCNPIQVNTVRLRSTEFEAPIGPFRVSLPEHIDQ